MIRVSLHQALHRPVPLALDRIFSSNCRQRVHVHPCVYDCNIPLFTGLTSQLLTLKQELHQLDKVELEVLEVAEARIEHLKSIC